jgi:2'-5' RNA ligase
MAETNNHMNDIVAVDWALIPEPDIVDFAVRLNQQLPNEKDRISLGHTAFYPHMTVAMCFVRHDRVEEMKAKLAALPAPRVIVFQNLIVWSFPGKYTSYFIIKPDKKVIGYHRECMRLMSKYLVEPQADAFFEPVGESTESYVRQFNLFAGENYWPHITLGYGKLMHDIPEFSAKARPGLFWLGNHCTCAFEL